MVAINFTIKVNLGTLLIVASFTAAMVTAGWYLCVKRRPLSAAIIFTCVLFKLYVYILYGNCAITGYEMFPSPVKCSIEIDLIFLEYKLVS